MEIEDVAICIILILSVVLVHVMILNESIKNEKRVSLCEKMGGVQEENNCYICKDNECSEYIWKVKGIWGFNGSWRRIR